MNRVIPVRLKPVLLLTALMGGMTITSCGSAPSSMSADAPSAVSSSVTANSVAQPMAAVSEAQAESGGANAVPRSLPQLVKTADLTLSVDSVETSITAIRTIARQQQGDVLGLNDQIPLTSGDRHTATLQIRVPQEKLEPTLSALANLGTLQRQAITAEDVSNQLVDFQARLRNLQRTEDTLLTIMERRSGSVGDVLKVAQELSNVRNSIEQIDAQLKDLRNRVAYSTINLSLEGAIASNPPQRAVSSQLGETWSGATRSLGKFTVSLLQLSIWLLVYSPYWLLIGVIIGGYVRFKNQPSRPSTPRSEPPAST